MHIHIHDETERRFLAEISKNFQRGNNNHEAAALFDAIQQAFTMDSHDSVVIHPEMVSHLAACSWVALDYDAHDRIPWDRGDHDYVLTRTLRYFLITLRRAIQEGRAKSRGGKTLHGCFTIPPWFVDECMRKCIDA